jgi:hypothetical protein
MNEFDMELITRLCFIFFLLAGVSALFSYLWFNFLLGSLARIMHSRRDLLELHDQYPLRSVIGRDSDDVAMRLVRDYGKSKVRTQLPEAMLSALHRTYKWYKLTMLFAILFVICFILIGVFHT